MYRKKKVTIERQTYKRTEDHLNKPVNRLKTINIYIYIYFFFFAKGLNYSR